MIPSPGPPRLEGRSMLRTAPSGSSQGLGLAVFGFLSLFVVLRCTCPCLEAQTVVCLVLGGSVITAVFFFSPLVLDVGLLGRQCFNKSPGFKNASAVFTCVFLLCRVGCVHFIFLEEPSCCSVLVPVPDVAG